MVDRILIRVCSFIPDAWISFVSAPLVGIQKIEFEGDHRTFTPFTRGTKRFRTAQEFEIDFRKRQVTHHGETGITRAQVLWHNGRVTEHAAQVKRNCLHFELVAWGIGSVSFRAKSSCANPLIPGAPSADYDLLIRVAKSGQVEVKGKHDGFPALEVYKKVNNVFQSLYLFDPYEQGGSLKSLLPPMEVKCNATG